MSDMRAFLCDYILSEVCDEEEISLWEEGNDGCQ